MNVKKFLSNEIIIYRVQIIMSVLFIYFTFFFNSKYFLPIQDYFEGEYTKKLIKSNHFNFFNLDYSVPNFLGGLKYNYLPPSEFNLSTIIEFLLPLKTSVLLVDLVSYLIFFIFTFKICRFYKLNKPSSITAASFAGFSGFYPTYSLTMVGLIVILFFLFKIRIANHDLNKYEILVLIISPIFYEIQFGGIWIFFIGLSIIFFLNKPLKIKYFLYFTYLLILLIFNYRLIYEIFFGVATNRTTFINELIQFDNFNIFLKDFFEVNFYGYWQILTAPKYYLGLFLVMGFLYIVSTFFIKRNLTDNQKLFLKIYLVIQIINLIFALSHSTFVNIDAIIGVRVKLFRIIMINQLLMPLALAVLLNQLKKSILIIPVFLFSFIVNDSALWKLTTPSSFSSINQDIGRLANNFGQKINYIDYQIMNGYLKIFPEFPTYQSFYSVEEDYFKIDKFNKLKKDLAKPLSEYLLVSYDIDPMITGFNNFYIMDGYFSIYPDTYRENFRNVIKNELEYQGERSIFLFDNHPQRLHLFDTDRYPSMDLKNINFCALNKIGATHLISQTIIEYDLLEIENRTDDLFLYKINYKDC